MASPITLLDAHVHIHDCFDISEFFDRAYENFRRAAAQHGNPRSFQAALCLTESSGVNWFHRLGQSIGDPERVGWGIRNNIEDCSLTASRGAGDVLSIVAGRQIVTAERLEILAIGLLSDFEDGLPIDDVISAVQDSGALCVLPWGFGKWTGQRGQVVRRLLSEDLGQNFFVGDNSGRLGLWPAPPEFGIAEARGIRLLPGSDPLPYGREVGTAGGFGLMLDGPIEDARPFESIRQRLLDPDSRAVSYGDLESLLPFVGNQVAMQLRRFGRNAG